MALTKISSDGYKDESVDLTKLPHGDTNNNGKFLRANNAADPTFETVNTDVAGDSTPQLGGDLDVNGNDIVSASNADIDIVPHGTGKTNLGGVSGVKLPVGDTSERVNVTGVIRFNSETGLPEYFNGTTYIAIDSPPSITSVSPTEVDSTAGGNETFTINGARFSVGATVKFISNNGTQINASSVTRNNSGQLSAVVAKNSFVNAQEPYDVKVTNASGLSAELADQINVDSAPSWQTSAGALGTKTIGDSVSITVSATDTEGDTIAYSVSSGSLPSGLSINSSTGVISGTLGGSATTTTFTLRATANSKTADRIFNIVSANPATGGNNIVTYSHGGVNYKVHVFTSNGTFTRSVVSSVDILVVAGGGGAGFGGGGAGALVWGTSKSLTDATYSVTIGNGGAGTVSNSSYAIPGQDSSFGSLVVAEGGGAGGRIQSVTDGNLNSGPGGTGGSGGGGGHPSGGNASSGAGGNAITGNSTGGAIYGNSGGAGFNCCNGGGGGGAGQIGQAGVGDPGSGENVGGNGHSTFVGDAASTAALLFVADLGTDGSMNATSGLSSNPGTLYLAGGGGGAYGSPRGGYGGGGTGGVSSGNTSGKSAGLGNSGSGGGAANAEGQAGGSGVVLVRYAV